MHKFLTKQLEDKTIVWFNATNNYIILEEIAAQLVQRILEKRSIQEIATGLAEHLKISHQEALKLIYDLNDQIVTPNTTKTNEEHTSESKYVLPSNFAFQKYYKIHTKIFKVQFLNEYQLSLIHPKFAHLEIQETSKVDHTFQLFTFNHLIHILLDDQFIGAWESKNVHYFQGKFSMKIIECIYNKSEAEWMGVFHASAINYNKDTILILGDSGNGKSTSLALLQAQGFQCIADDFVPIDQAHDVYSFPAGISIKKKALPVLLKEYPTLKTSAEYHYERLNKTVRYLPPEKIDYHKKAPCKALVFIKYDESVDFEISEISKLNAFEHLVPDSWISSVPKNAAAFLEWFEQLPCYQLTYSNNELM
ncbi:MAG: hypothetical protein ACPG6C_06630, partial [Flavobacteriaceae bacterium]